VRGSYPVSGESTIEMGGNTTCLEVHVAGHLLIIDAGTGIISLNDEIIDEYDDYKKPFSASILFTHMHHDHNQGFPFFQPIYDGNSSIYIFGPRVLHKNIMEMLADAMINPYYSVEFNEIPSIKEVRTIREFDTIYFIEGVEKPEVRSISRDSKFETERNFATVKCMKSYAHPGTTLIYKIIYKNKSMVFATDTEGYINGDRKLITYCKDTDLLIHDAQYTTDEYLGTVPPCTQGWGHSTPEMALTVAKMANAKQLVLFHHDPNHDDKFIRKMEEETKNAFPDTISAQEGLEIKLL
jgi:phosphoribosyl 1,2-cyclic phosphodiesterase